MPLTRRGFALIELLVAALLGAVLSVLVGKLLLQSAATLRDRSERTGLEQSLRVSVGAAQAMLEPLGIDSASGADFWGAGPASLVARVIRGAGVLCDATADRLVLRAGPRWWRGLRLPVPNRDSLIIASVLGSERWIVAPLAGNASTGTCPDGSLALVLPTELPSSSLLSVGPGSPLQVFEPVELRLYPSSGASWLGLRLAATAEAIQPLAGPFSSTGSRLDYRDLHGNVVAMVDAAVVTLSLEGETERAGGVGVARLDQAHSDSVRITVALRGRR